MRRLLLRSRRASCPLLLALLALGACDGSRWCPSGSVHCRGGCAELGTDTDCGACGDACEADRVCRAGSCSCPRGQLSCGGGCVDPASDPAHCGACDVRCGEAQCQVGECVCPAGATLCDEQCVDIRADDRHCGSCGAACEGELRCADGECRCPAGEQLCGGECVDTRVTFEHCGACGNACSLDRLCEGGACACVTGSPCPGGCRDLERDPANCGACGASCAALVGAPCLSGRCVPRLAWARWQSAVSRYGMAGRDTALAHGPDGDVLAAWTVNGYGYARVELARFAPDGVERWRRSFASGFNVQLTALAWRAERVLVATDGGALVALREDTGAPLFTLTLGEAVDDLAIAPDGTAVVAGNFRDTMSAAGRALVSRGHRDIFVVRVDELGTITQAHAFGGIADDFDARVAVDADGEIYLAGDTGAGLSLGGPMLGTSSAEFIGCLSPTGAHRWSERLAFAKVHDIDATPDGVVLLGVLTRSTTVGGIALTDTGMFAASWRRDGTGRWALSLGGSPGLNDEGGIAYTPSAVLVTTGFRGEVAVGGTRLWATDGRDVFLAALTPETGAGLWVSGFGGPYDDDSHAIVASDGAVTMIGRFAGPVDFGGRLLSSESTSYEDSFVARYEL